MAALRNLDGSRKEAAPYRKELRVYSRLAQVTVLLARALAPIQSQIVLQEVEHGHLTPHARLMAVPAQVLSPLHRLTAKQEVEHGTHSSIASTRMRLAAYADRGRRRAR